METRQPIISHEPQLKTAYVRNIGNDISREELIDLFALNKTPFLETHSRVSVVHGSDQNSVIIEVPEKVHDEMLKLNGMTYKGHHMIISATQTRPATKGVWKVPTKKPKTRETNNPKWNIWKSTPDCLNGSTIK